MPTPRPTASDLQHARATLAELRNPTPCGDTDCPLSAGNPDGCDCHASEVIVLSTGYAEVHATGELTGAHGTIDLDNE